MTRKDRWATINRCVVCGTKLVFLRSTTKDAQPEEGAKSCSQNHATFQVIGGYNSAGDWSFDFVMPIRSSTTPTRKR